MAYEYAVYPSLGHSRRRIAALPAGAGLLILAGPIVRLLFLGGEFEAHGAERTAAALTGWSIENDPARPIEFAFREAMHEPGDGEPVEIVNNEDLPFRVIVPAFVLSELKTAFQMGFLLFLPFLVIDLVGASVLISMGMFMLPPIMISTPFKILLFVLVDGWHLVCESLVTSFIV